MEESFGFERTVIPSKDKSLGVASWAVWLAVFFVLGSMTAHCYYTNIG
jgi:hypothetical protein